MKEDSFKDFVLEQLSSVNNLRCKQMFGGYGLYDGSKFFGIISKGRLYFKTDEISKNAYVEQGMKPFKPNNKQILKNYYEVPADVLEDRERILEFAEKSISIVVT